MGHGGDVKSGIQTVEGRKRINAATRMKAFWDEWRAAGKPSGKIAYVQPRERRRGLFHRGPPKNTAEQRRAPAIAELKRVIPGWEP